MAAASLVCAVLVGKSCLTLCEPVGCSPPGSSVHGISRVRIVEWVAIFFSRGSSQPGNQTRMIVQGITGYCKDFNIGWLVFIDFISLKQFVVSFGSSSQSC